MKQQSADMDKVTPSIRVSVTFGLHLLHQLIVARVFLLPTILIDLIVCTIKGQGAAGFVDYV